MMVQKERKIRLPNNNIVWVFFVWLLYKGYKEPENLYIDLVYFIIIIYVFCQLYMFWITKRLVIQVEPFPEKINKEEKVTLNLTILNTSLLPLCYTYIFLKESLHMEVEGVKCLCLTLPPHSQKHFTFTLKGIYSGKEEIGISKVVICDYLELVKRKVAFTWEQPLIILPQVRTMKNVEQLLNYTPRASEADEELNKTKLEVDGEVSYELKPYQEGESQRLMHWKLVAQRDIYMVRQREKILKTKKERVIIFEPYWCEMQKRKEERLQAVKVEDKHINACISYIYKVLEHGEGIYLFYYLDGKWQSKHLKVVQELQDIGDLLSRSTIKEMQKSKDIVKADESMPLVPHLETNGIVQRVMILTGDNMRWEEHMVEEENLLVVRTHKRMVSDEIGYGQCWYITDEYQVVISG